MRGLISQLVTNVQMSFSALNSHLLDSHSTSNENKVPDLFQIISRWRPDKASTDANPQFRSEDLTCRSPEPFSRWVRRGVLYGELEVRFSSLGLAAIRRPEFSDLLLVFPLDSK